MASSTSMPKIIHYSCCVSSNKQSSDPAGDPECSYSDGRTGTIVDRASEYRVAIERVDVSGSCLPTFACPIQAGQSDPTLSTLSFTLSLTWRGNLAATETSITVTNAVVAKSAYGVGSLIQRTSLVLTNGTYTLVDFASMVQTVVQGAGGPFAAATVVVSSAGTLVMAGPSDCTVGWDLWGQTASALLGGYRDLGPHGVVWGALPNAPADTETYTQQTFTRQAFLSWSPDDSTAPIPPPPTSGQVVASPFYFAYTISHVCTLLQQTIGAAMVNLEKDFHVWWENAGAGRPCPGLQTRAPEISFSPQSKLISIAFSPLACGVQRTSAGLSSPGADEQLSLWCNSALYGYLYALPGTTTAEGSALGQDFLLDVSSARAGTFLDGTQALVLSTDGACTSVWSPVASLVLCTWLPVRPEMCGPTTSWSDSDTLSASVSSSNQSSPIFTDISLSSAEAIDVRGQVTYVPAALRWLELVSSSAVTRVSLQMFWRAKQDSQLRPLTLLPGPSSSMTAKFVFRRNDILW